MPILSGPNRGLWWSLASAGSGYASGRRAIRQMHLIAALVNRGDVVWDVGAHHGFVSLCAARRVGPSGEVHAFEPSERNRWFLARHLAWNAVGNVIVHPFALSSYDGESGFGGEGTSKTFALGAGDDRVPVRTGRAVVAAGLAPPPAFVKVDVEGEEAGVLAGLVDVLPPDAILLVAVHSRAAYDRCADHLRGAGYDIAHSLALAASLGGPWRSDPDMLCFGPAHPSRALMIGLLRALGFT